MNLKTVRATSVDKDCKQISSDRLEQLSQSKLTQQELTDLQKATHFDKKELQQWYKGKLKSFGLHPLRASLTASSNNRLPQGLPQRHAHEGRIPEDIPTVLPVW